MKRLFAAVLASFALHSVAAPAPLSAADPRLQPASVTLIEPAGKAGFPEVFIDGYLHEETVEEFKRLGHLNGSGLGMVYFNSPGGDLASSVELGQLIRGRGFSTRVGRKSPSGEVQPGRCESGCPFAFAGGRFRFLEGSSRMGLHQFYRAAGEQDNDLALAQVASTLIATHLSAMGVSLNLMERMVAADSGSMHYLTPLEAYDLGLINAGALPAQWSVQEVGGAIVLVGQQEKVQGTGKIALACSKGNNVELAGLFKAWFNPDLLRSLDQAALMLDGHPIADAGAASKPSVRNGFLSFTTRPSAQQLVALSQAESVGLQYGKAGTDVRASFEVDARGAGALIASFVNLCHGQRTSLTDAL